MERTAKAGKSYPMPPNMSSETLRTDLRKKSRKDPAGVIASIVRNQHSLYSKEMTHWKVARNEAESILSPRRITLLDLYDDIALDPFLLGLCEKRRLRITNKPFQVIDTTTKDVNEDLTNLINKQWLREFVKMAIDSHFYGHSLAYLNERTADGLFKSVELVNRKHVRPQAYQWVKREYDLQGFDYRERPYKNYMIPIGQRDNLGLFNPAAPLYILKKHSWSSWDEFEEVFGVPIRVAKVASQDPLVRAEIQNWLKEMGTASYGMFPPDAELDIKESNRADAHEVFNEKRKAVNEELEIMLLGVKNASQDTGTYGQQKALQDEQDEVQEDDLTWISNLINDELFPRLVAHGYPISENHRFVWDNTRAMDPKDKVTIYESLDRMGYILDEEQISNDLNVKLDGKRAAEPKADPNIKPIPKTKDIKKKKGVKREEMTPEALTSLDVIAELRKTYFHVPKS